jgi:diacylglycerol kinase (ATP)
MSKRDDPAALQKRLDRKQAKHADRLARVEAATAELDRATRKLRATEAAIADLERRLAAPRKLTLGSVDPHDGPLTPAVLIFNPWSGKKHDNGVRLAQCVAKLREHGIDAEVKLKTSGKAARRHAREAVEAGAGLVICAGGDGTLQDVASQLVGTETTFAILPTGTSNDVARSLGIPLELDDACALIGTGITRQLDMGRVIGDGRPHVEHFLDVAGVGLFAVGALAGQAYRKHRWNLFPKALRQALETRTTERLHVELDGVPMDPVTQLVTVSNCPMMGPRVLCAPAGKMDDGVLDVAVYDGLSEAQLIEHFAAAKLGKDSGMVPTYQAKQVRIAADAKLPTSTDMKHPPAQDVVDIVVIPHALRTIVGNGIALTVPVASAPDVDPFADGPPPATRADADKPHPPE